MSNPVVGLLQGDLVNPLEGLDPFNNPNAAALAQPSLTLVKLGQTLYSALFQGTMRDSWVTAQGIAQHRGEALRLRLGLKGNRLPRLPWEVLHSTDISAERLVQGTDLGAAARPLASGTHTIFSRYQPGTRLVSEGATLAIDAGQPLRILMVIAAPTDQERLELQREANHLQQELQRGNPDSSGTSVPEMELTILSQPGREQLTQALEQGNYHVLHYAGHSNLSAAGGSLYLVNPQTGLTEIFSGDDLAGLLVNNGIRLAVFNSCRGAYTAAVDPSDERERNLAEALVSRGMPAVLAMAEQIPDNVALTLTWLFYRNLKQGYPIDLSLSRARQGLISAYSSHQFYWALPILYIHPDFDGYLTPGDRSFNNPADRLVLMPPTYDAFFPTLAGEEGPRNPAEHQNEPRDEDLVVNAVLAEDEMTDWEEELDYLDDESYAEDASVVADLMQQLAPQSITPPQLAAPVRERSSSNYQTAAVSPQSSMSLGHRSGVSVLSQQPGLIKQPQEALQTWEEPMINTRPENSYDVSPVTLDAQPVGKAVGKPTPQPLWQRRHIRLPLLGMAGATAAALIGFWLFPQIRLTLEGMGVPGVNSLPSEVSLQDLRQRETQDVLTIAIDSFNKKQFEQGRTAVTALLERGAIKEAETALGAVSPQSLSDPNISFLRGRVAWEATKTGDTFYSVSDARRFWEIAAKGEPESVLYQNALGFAYYAEGNTREALKVWMRASYGLENFSAVAVPTAGSSTSTESPRANPLQLTPERLTTYAGIAIGLQRIAADETYGQRSLTSKAMKLYQMVSQKDPTQFRPQALSQNWLWTEAAIQDWEKLSRQTSQN
jgi:hypothetical protein